MRGFLYKYLMFFSKQTKKKNDTYSLENIWLFLAYFFLQCNLDVSRDQPPAIWSWKNYKPFQVHDLLQHLRGWGVPHILLGAAHVEGGEKRITTPFRFWKWLDNPVTPKKVQLSFCLGGVVNSTKKTP